MERKIGEIFEYNGEWYQCVRSDTYCTGCAFYWNKGLCNDIIGNCDNFIFKKLEKVGEPYTTFVDKIVQNYLLETAVSVPPKDVFTLINNEQRLIAVEIKQNKEEMEEKKAAFPKEDNALTRVVYAYVNGKISDKELISSIKEVSNEYPYNKNNLKPFSLELAKQGRPVCTRDGHKARIICFDRVTNSTNEYRRSLVVLITNPNGDEQSWYYTDKGVIIGGYKYDNYDLMMLPEKKEGWVNVYKGGLLDTKSYPTKKEAFDKACPEGYVDTVKISWEE